MNERFAAPEINSIDNIFLNTALERGCFLKSYPYPRSRMTQLRPRRKLSKIQDYLSWLATKTVSIARISARCPRSEPGWAMRRGASEISRAQRWATLAGPILAKRRSFFDDGKFKS
jgi:hypothetical protein